MRRYTMGLGEREFVTDVEELDADRFQVVVGEDHYEVRLTAGENLPAATFTPSVQSAGDSTPAPAPRAPRRRLLPRPAPPHALVMLGVAFVLLYLGIARGY